MANHQVKQRYHKTSYPSGSDFLSGKGSFYSSDAPEMFDFFANEEARRKYAQQILSSGGDLKQTGPGIRGKGKVKNPVPRNNAALPIGRIKGPVQGAKKSATPSPYLSPERTGEFKLMATNLGIAKTTGWKSFKNFRNFLGNTTLANLKTRPWAIIPAVDVAIIIAQGVFSIACSLGSPNSTYLSKRHNEFNRGLDVSFNVIDTVANLSTILKCVALLQVAEASVNYSLNAIDAAAGMISLAVIIGKTIYDAAVQSLRQQRCKQSQKKFGHRLALYQQLQTAFNPHATYDQNSTILLKHFVDSEITRLSLKHNHFIPLEPNSEAEEKKGREVTQLQLLLRLEKKLKDAYANKRYQALSEQEKSLLLECIQLNQEKLALRAAVEAEINKEFAGIAFKITRLGFIALALVLFNLAPVAIPGALTVASLAMPLTGWAILVFWTLADAGRRLSRTDWGKKAFEEIEKSADAALENSTFLKNKPRLMKAVQAVILPFQYILLTFRAIPHYAPLLMEKISAGLSLLINKINVHLGIAPVKKKEKLEKEAVDEKATNVTPRLPVNTPVKTPTPDSWANKKANYSATANKNSMDWDRLRAKHGTPPVPCDDDLEPEDEYLDQDSYDADLGDTDFTR